MPRSGPEDVILIGRDGILIEVHSASHEELPTNYLLCSLALPIRNFVRTFILDDFKHIRRPIMDYKKILTILGASGRDEQRISHIILLKEILEYLQESLEEMQIVKDIGGKRLFKVLDVPNMRRDIMLRCKDLVNIQRAGHQLMTL